MLYVPQSFIMIAEALDLLVHSQLHCRYELSYLNVSPDQKHRWETPGRSFSSGWSACERKAEEEMV